MFVLNEEIQVSHEEEIDKHQTNDMQLEIDLDSQYSSRQSVASQANTGRIGDVSHSNATEGAIQEGDGGHDTHPEAYTTKASTRQKSKKQYIDFNTINDVSIDTDEQNNDFTRE